MVLFHRFDFFFRDTNYIQPPLPVFPLFHFLTHPFLFYLGFHSLGGFSDFLHDFIMFSLQSVLPYVFCNLVFVSDTILSGFFFLPFFLDFITNSHFNSSFCWLIFFVSSPFLFLGMTFLIWVIFFISQMLVWEYLVKFRVLC